MQPRIGVKAPWSILVVVVVVVVAGCSFELPSPEGDAGADPGDPATADRCTDPDLRLCLDFEQPEPRADLSDNLPIASDIGVVTFGPRGAEQAATLASSSALRLGRPPAGAPHPLDLRDRLTLELWLQVAAIPDNRASIFDHDQKYAMAYGADRRIGCGIAGGGSVTSDEVTIGVDGTWHHVACTYDQRELRLFIDGRLVACRPEDHAIMPADDDTLIGARSGKMAPSEFFQGGLDNIHVLARALMPSEICQAAGQTDCPMSCGESDTGGGQD